LPDGSTANLNIMIYGIIPARYGSTRFPGKPLADIGGKPMIWRVVEQARQATRLDRVVVATDDERIAAVVRDFGGEVVLTRTDHPSGTDRCFEAWQHLTAGQTAPVTGHPSPDYVLNIQGDEPFIDPRQIDQLATILDGTVELATQMTPITSAAVLHDDTRVKITHTSDGNALYFSRQPIPFLRGLDPARWHEAHSYRRHIGLYAYRVDVLQQITRLPVSSLEKAESLEQLRWLEAGYRIRLVLTEYDSPGIDTPEQLPINSGQ
jgi:3-deoxy-manno-octulosonate cytidylyltransferase (CMP-KDO synthetase)